MTEKFTFLKVDIVEHSRLLTAEPPYIVWPLLDKFLDLVIESSKKYGGKVWNWQGDGGLCAFPAGEQLEKVQNAIEAALDILYSVSPYCVSSQVEPFLEAKQKLKIRIALHYGDANVQKDLGRVHSPDINLVAHLERLASPNSIIVTEKTLKCCNDEIKRLFQPANPDKFENEPIWICELFGARKLKTWDTILSGIAILLRKIEDKGFRPDLIIGCTRSGGIVGAMLAGNLGQENFVVLNRKDKGTRGIREIVFDNVVILNNEHVLPRDSKILMCFYQINTGETMRTFKSYLDSSGFNDILIATLFLYERGRQDLQRCGHRYVHAFELVPDWGNTPWKLNEAWKWV
jgi:class 3 adenylate cyclase/hypoxanthine phosphoribosyltransferase